MRTIILFVLNSAILLTGCATSVKSRQTAQSMTSVTPSPLGVPNSLASLGPYEFVSVQGTGQIFTYSITSGSQVLIEPVYQAPCSDPSGMVITSIAESNVMPEVCYCNGFLLYVPLTCEG